MKKKYRLEDLGRLTAGMMGAKAPKDITVHYRVTKEKGSSPDMTAIIKCIRDYIQNMPVYFAGDNAVGFVDGVLCFSVVGEKNDHASLREILGGDMEKLNCNLAWSK